MSGPAEDQTALKQAYLRKHIPADKYEDFGQFCENLVGSIDIEAWSLQYVYELVDKFKRNQADKLKNNKKTGAFHLYQTGSEDELKDVAKKIKKEKQEKEQEKHQKEQAKNEVKAKNNQPQKVKEEKSALDVLDSIFKNQPAASQYQTKKYDKAFFESCNFWGVPEQPKAKSTPTKNKQTQPNKFTSNNLPPLQNNFEKMFQTGLALPQHKMPPKAPKKEEKPIFVEITIEDDPPSKQPDTGNSSILQPTSIIMQPISSVVHNNSKVVPSNKQKKSDIKLVSVKDIRAPKQSKLPFEGQVLIRQPFKDTVACFKSFERAALSSKDLKVTIESHEIIARSFFSSDYPMFHLKVLPANIICKRNLQDFQKLRRNLQNVYPGVRLPYLQKLGWLQSQTSIEYIQRQKKYLCYFLQDVLQNNELKNSRILQDFLTLKDHKQMKRKFEEYDKIKKITSIQELCLLQGEVKVEVSEANRQYNQLLQGFLAKTKIFWATQERILAQISQMHSRLAESYNQLKVFIQDISKQTKQFNRRVRFNEVEELEDSFRNLGQYVSQSMNVNKKQAEFLDSQVLVYLRYEKQNMNMFDDIISTRNQLTRAYLKRKETEKTNDNIEFLSQRLKDVKVGVLDQSSNITVLKYQCGYINSLLANEGQRYFKLLSAKMEQMISDVCYCKLDYLGRTINTFTALVYS